MERIFKFAITHIDWDTMEDGTPVEVNLPSSDELTITTEDDEVSDEVIANALSDKHGWCVNNFSAHLISITVEMTDEQKNKYIDETYEDEDFIECFRALLGFRWIITYYPDTPEKEFQCILYTDNGHVIREQDQLDRSYAEGILGETF